MVFQLKLRDPNSILINSYDTVEKKSVISIPNNTNNAESIAYFKIFKDLDAILGSDEFKKRIFGKNSKKAKYSPIVKVPTAKDDNANDDDDDDDDAKKSKSKKKGKGDKKDEKPREPPMEYITTKFDLDYDTKKIKTKIYKLAEDEKGKLTPECEINAETIEDVKKHIKFRTQVLPIILVTKIWSDQKVTKIELPDNTKVEVMKYGATLTLLQLGFKESNMAQRVTLSQPSFDDDD